MKEIKAAEEKFKEASEAYHVLSNQERKQNYDNFGHAAFENGGGGRGGFGNFDFSSHHFQIFLKIFLEKDLVVEEEDPEDLIIEVQTLRYDLSITLEEAYTGKKQDIKFSTSKNVILVKEVVLNQAMSWNMFDVWRTWSSKI